MFLLALAAPAHAYDPAATDDQPGPTRVFVLSDMGNEPDDQMSFVRLLLYANELELEGLCATTSTWQKDKVQPETMRAIVRAYGGARANLQKHADGWPEAATLEARVTSGPASYGMSAVGKGQTSPGAEALLRAAARDDPRPLWITVWGGANTLAQALDHARATRTKQELDALVGRLRVYSISDQDDAGPWIRREFPSLFYVVKPSTPNGEEYASATWTGISGDAYYRNGDGADATTVTNEWLDAHVRGKGPLGQYYPKFAFIMEGDTPAFLGLTDNGLASRRSPSWGGWGGRYVYRQPYGETRPIWTQGGDLFARVTSQDRVAGADGKERVSDQATIWRWREAFQHDLAARMDWTVAPFEEANHAPVVMVNGAAGTEPLAIDVTVGQPVVLDAAGTRDRDGNALRYRWFHYEEAGHVPGVRLAALAMDGTDGPRATVTPMGACRPNWLPVGPPCTTGVAHVILAVTDDGLPSLTSYRRVVLRVRAAPSGGAIR